MATPSCGGSERIFFDCGADAIDEAMERLVRCVEKGRCPGDDFADRVIEHGVAAEVSRVAQSAQGGL